MDARCTSIGQNHQCKGKFDARVEASILFGYCRGDAYRILLSASNNILETKDVQFTEGFMAPVESHRENLIVFDIENNKIILNVLDDSIHVMCEETAPEADIPIHTGISTPKDGTQDNEY